MADTILEAFVVVVLRVELEAGLAAVVDAIVVSETVVAVVVDAVPPQMSQGWLPSEQVRCVNQVLQ